MSILQTVYAKAISKHPELAVDGLFYGDDERWKLIEKPGLDPIKITQRAAAWLIQERMASVWGTDRVTVSDIDVSSVEIRLEAILKRDMKPTHGFGGSW